MNNICCFGAGRFGEPAVPWARESGQTWRRKVKFKPGFWRFVYCLGITKADDQRIVAKPGYINFATCMATGGGSRQQAGMIATRCIDALAPQWGQS